ncbi:Asp23/Gls24 family envelope stress response protein [Arthrobacter sp. M4]|uniref:Asp23/Gls24 family envelope stress response protein n=1 Tax=Arthrobacter sp. M4 TaxID=218160 RepID=UPI001CDCD7E3|nr:Asp23/Gls24 family envelope stress response protein [Arthrobacter sp. M4]MCA4134214.1 Asp23/Gls24 family envelope stress response protein [Arthrobacter sp. M4]
MENQNTDALPGNGHHTAPVEPALNEPVPVPPSVYTDLDTGQLADAGDGVEVDAGGRTIISESAVAKVAGIAARSVPGVYSLGSGPSRALGAIRDAVGSSDHAAGVRAEVGETQVAVDINLVAVYGKPLHRIADEVRAAVYRAVEELVGLEVIEVNVEINDVYVAPVPKAAPARPATSEREPLQ